MAYTKYSLTPADNNAAPPDGAPEGMLPSAVNDTMRDMMAQIRDVGDGIRGGTYTMTAPVITGGSVSGATGSFSTLAASGTTTLSANAIISVTDNSNAALRITQLGTGNALLVEDSANPDSTPFVIDASGAVITGYTQSQSIAGSTYQYQMNGPNPFAAIRWNPTNAQGLTALFGRSRSATVGTNSSISNNDGLGTLAWVGDDGTAFVQSASISAAVDGTPGTNDMPGRLVFSTTADGASSPTERMRIDSAGAVLIGATSTDAGVNLLVSSATGSATPVPTEIRIATTSNAGDWSTTDPWGRLSFYSGDGSDAGPKIQGSIDFVSDTAAGGRGSLVFNTAAATTGTLTRRMSINSSGQVVLSSGSGLLLSATAVTSPSATDGNVFSGTYTPTLTNVTNVTSSTANNCHYMRVGNTVTVSGSVIIAPTATGNTTMRMSLPVASNLSGSNNVGGVGAAQTTTQVCTIYADTTNDTAFFRLQAAATTSLTYNFSFTYRII